MTARVVITAMGVVSALGNSRREIARSFELERVCFRRADALSPVVAPVDDFDVRHLTGRHKNLRYLNRGAAMAVAAAVEAIRRSRVPAPSIEASGLFVGAGPNLDLGAECPRIENGDIAAEGMAALWILRFLPNTAASTIAQLSGLRGENLTVGTACAASMQALGEAYRRIKDGYLDRAVAGGGDSRLNAGALLAYAKAQALYTGTASPDQASRPFDRDRQGFVPGEGAAFFMLERAEQALERKAPILAEVCGYGASMDGHAMTAPRPDGRWAEQAVIRALADAGLEPDAVDIISSHGTGTPLNDAVEADLIERCFGDSRPQVVALKSWIGHLAAACGAVELALCLSALASGRWPAIRNLGQACNPNLNYARTRYQHDGSVVLLQNFGFGGQNSALVVKRWHG
jgi:3-oxoacyl-[acyl-carrier-protein] synthase II